MKVTQEAVGYAKRGLIIILYALVGDAVILPATPQT
jgi:hypothetical protein